MLETGLKSGGLPRTLNNFSIQQATSNTIPQNSVTK